MERRTLRLGCAPRRDPADPRRARSTRRWICWSAKTPVKSMFWHISS